MLHDYIADLHIHIGRTRKGEAVKISAAPSLTLERILGMAGDTKGIDIVGVIDCHVDEVLRQIEEAVEHQAAYPLAGGGLQFSRVTLFPGTEIELSDEAGQGPVHVLLFMPTLESMRELSDWLAQRMKNPRLSSQRVYERAKTVQKKVRELDGLFIPAHVFTPFKSVYGKGVKRSLAEIFDPDLIDAIELGLSSDTTMADQIEELHRYPYLTNSDAHSLEKMAREYQMIRLGQPSFSEFKQALKNEQGRMIVSNFGLNPLLGKYYQTRCAVCGEVTASGTACSACGSHKQIKGVADRLRELKSGEGGPASRPPYVHQIPLEFIPKLGKKTLEKLRAVFGTDMNIIHRATAEELQAVVPSSIANDILAARANGLEVEAGGGGTYGKVRRIIE
ncbi:endonuclease Q family protein [Alkalihalobacillus oceani]|uniref:Endonuclease Q family protein n=1 Tax=Halalkalibacter oceani TaxID=1653776 RepID=A0A9X2DQY5_9BACI|nr:endonuclease Q family protein [Halalkalibacter oceani]MCM3714843.1 endonuclease Q family protein [Halalkalibacter oceani]